MSFLSFFWPQVIEKVVSPISGEVKVIEQFGKKRMEIGGMTQSGGIVEKIWRGAMKEIFNFQFSIFNCLILGLGAGSVAKILTPNTKYQIPNTRIIAVEIDPEVVRLGKKYFGLREIENLEIIIGDAVKYVNQPFNYLPVGKAGLTIKPFDLILVDLYQGREIPKSCQTKRFLEELRKVKEKKGLIVFNRLYSKEKRPETDRFVQKCQQIFDKIETKKAVCNLMVFCE